MAVAEPIAAPTATATVDTPRKEDYFQPVSGTQYIRRFVQVYVGHLDTFLIITVVALLPAVVGYQWMLLGRFGSSWIFHYLLLPLTRQVANGAAVTATAFIYLMEEQQQQIPWKKAIQIACRKRVFSRWFLQSLYSNLSFLLAPLGIFTFTTQFLLLEPNSTLLGSMISSATLVFRRPGTFVAIIFFTFVVTPMLCSMQTKLVNFFLPFASTSSQEEKEEEEDEEGLLVDPWAQGRQEIHKIISLPLVSCLWTILYLNICLQRNPGLKREAMAQELGIQLPPSVVARVH